MTKFENAAEWRDEVLRLMGKEYLVLAQGARAEKAREAGMSPSEFVESERAR